MTRVEGNPTEFAHVGLEDVEKLAKHIEGQLWNRFVNTTNKKYRSCYRNIMFMVKDEKNNGLFRMIVTGKISPGQLTGMTSEQMAARDPQMWWNTHKKMFKTVRWYF